MIKAITGFFSNAKFILLALLIGLVIGGVTGWYEKSIRVSAAQTKVVIEARKDDAKAGAVAQDKQLALDDKKENNRVQIKYITKEIVKYVPQTITEVTHGNDCPSSVLSVGAVRLLNAARSGEVVDPSAWIDEEVIQDTEIGLQELSVADIELTEQFQELAANHDALVDAVAEYQAEQRKRLGIK